MIDMHTAALAYIRFVLQETKQSPTALAEAAGIAASTLTRPLNNPDHKYNISNRTIGKIAAATGIMPGPFFRSRDAVELNQAVYGGETHDPEIWGEGSDKPYTGSVITIGDVAAGHWRELEVADLSKYLPLGVISVYYPPWDCFGVIVRGTSINRIARDGDCLLCVKVDAARRPLAPKMLVVIERTSEDGRLVEISAKRLKLERGKWQLWPDSDDPSFQTPLEVGELDGSDHVKVLGIVECVVRDV